ncbi:molybdopterin molybdenumtransferase MoeA [Spirochaetia bacterium]|nr:molybdopterin molybdenumtransferase MoeA [Spirochaetia bacterium]
MKLLTVDTIEEARQKLLDCVKGRKLPVEYMAVTQALGRVLAEDITTPADIPAFRRSTVDGYAVISTDTAGAGESLPVFLSLAGSVEMGRVADFSLRRGQCAYVPTGGMIPGSADAVVMVEHSEPFDEKSVAIYEPAAVGSHIARVGEDVRRGSSLLRRGTKIRSPEAGALAAAGIVEVAVYAPLNLTILSTGDELVPPAASPRPGETRDINTWALAALAAQSGYRIIASHILKDDCAALEAAVRKAMQTSDIVALSGGSSQGAKDMTAEVFSRVAQPGVLCHGLAIKPGKPTILAFDQASGVVLAGLPGHPVSALMVFRVLLSWLTITLTGQMEPFPVPAKMVCNLAGSPGRAVYQPVALVRSGDGYLAEPLFGKSGMMSTLTGADGYVIIDLNKEGLQKGEEVWVHLWRE